MDAHGLFSGRWPRQGVNTQLIEAALQAEIEKNHTWGESTILGFPSMNPHPFGIQVFSSVQAKHANAILTHTRGDGEKGFKGTHNIEKALIHTVGDLLGDSTVDGYVTPGGTEANIMGIWIGREKLRAEFGNTGQLVAVLASSASHYSLPKACALTDMGRGELRATGQFQDLKAGNGSLLNNHHVPESDGSGLHYIRCSECGRIDVAELERTIRRLHAEQHIARFIIFLNEGTTMTGAMDDTEAVGRMVRRLREEFQHQLGFYVHVDAAYGGCIYPFLDPDGTWAFRVPEVDSLTVDPYKMGYCPMAEGLFLCRSGLQRFIQQPTGYVNDGHDDTLCGSRSAAYAASCWAVIHALGTEGYQTLHTQNREKAQRLHQKLAAVPSITLLPQYLNMVAFRLPDDVPQEAYDRLRAIVDEYICMWNWFNPDPSDPKSRPYQVIKCCMTQDVKDEWLDAFVQALTDTFVRLQTHV